MNDQVLEMLFELTGARSVTKKEVIQSLWSGYGEISRFCLVGSDYPSVVVKHVKLPDSGSVNHPRGWNTDLSHQRKVKSYQVESAWYRDYRGQCNDACRVPRCYALKTSDSEFLMILEDLDSSGFPVRKTSATLDEIKACLKWLAHFHSTFLTVYDLQIDIDSRDCFESLWNIGTYWHLATRPDELEALSDTRLKKAAHKIDQLLSECPYQTLVHGDAKLANFCFSESGREVAAVDFQYVGAGCGMKDVAYFIGSCFNGEECERFAESLVDYYFECLTQAIIRNKKTIDPTEVENAWRPLFSVAWADFQRFLKGWSPDHWKIHRYSEKVTKEALKKIPLI